jgi:hypothetical protein
MAALSDNPATSVGQVSADGQFRWDGQQWVPIPRGVREPTPWTRPMQLASAAFFVIQALYSVIVSVIFINRDTMLRVMRAQGTSIPQNTDINTVLSISIFFALAFVIVIAVLELVAALGSYLGWRWMFWVALVLFALGGLGALTNLGTFAHPDTSPLPIAAVAISELFAVASLALFIWLLIGLIRYGPWAMKRPGA